MMKYYWPWFIALFVVGVAVGQRDRVVTNRDTVTAQVDSVSTPGPIIVYDRRADSLYTLQFMPGEAWMWDSSIPVFGITPQSFEAHPQLIGDVNGDGLVKLSDVTYLVNYVLKGGPAPVEVDPFRAKMMLVGEDPIDTSDYEVGHLLLIKRR